MAKELSDMTRQIRVMLSESPVYDEGKHKGKPRLAYSEALPQLQELGIIDAKEQALIDLPPLSENLKRLHEENEFSDPSDLCKSADLRRYEDAENVVRDDGKNATKTRVVALLGWGSRRVTKVTDEREWRNEILSVLKPQVREEVEEELALRSLYLSQQNSFNVVKYQWSKDKPKSSSRKPAVSKKKVEAGPPKKRTGQSPRKRSTGQPPRKRGAGIQVSTNGNGKKAKKVKTKKAPYHSFDEAAALAEKFGGVDEIAKTIKKIKVNVSKKTAEIAKMEGEITELESVLEAVDQFQQAVA